MRHWQGGRRLATCWRWRSRKRDARLASCEWRLAFCATPRPLRLKNQCNDRLQIVAFRQSVLAATWELRFKLARVDRLQSAGFDNVLAMLLRVLKGLDRWKLIPHVFRHCLAAPSAAPVPLVRGGRTRHEREAQGRTLAPRL